MRSPAAIASHTGGGSDDLDLGLLRARLNPYGVLAGARRIRRGDEAAFGLPGPVTPASLARRRASGAARIAARGLLSEFGADPSAPLPRTLSGAPLWPEGIVGSLAHDEKFAVAAAGRRGPVVGLGIDVEPAEPLPDDLVDLVLSEAERREARGGVARRLVFAGKEAVFKAIHPLDGTPLEFSDIAVFLAEGSAMLRDGRRLRLFAVAGERLVAVALAFGPEDA